MENLRILSLGRNLIKKIENLDAVAETLEELWISYNQITGLVSCCLDVVAWAVEPYGTTLQLPTRDIGHGDIRAPQARTYPSAPTISSPQHRMAVIHRTLNPPDLMFCVLLAPQSGIEKLVNLRVLFMANNKIAGWGEVDKLGALDKLEDLLLVGNPLYNDYKDNNATSEYRIEVGPRSAGAGVVAWDVGGYPQAGASWSACLWAWLRRLMRRHVLGREHGAGVGCALGVH